VAEHISVDRQLSRRNSGDGVGAEVDSRLRLRLDEPAASWILDRSWIVFALLIATVAP
jgi:hypothetical protein